MYKKIIVCALLILLIISLSSCSVIDSFFTTDLFKSYEPMENVECGDNCITDKNEVLVYIKELRTFIEDYYIQFDETTGMSDEQVIYSKESLSTFRGFRSNEISSMVQEKWGISWIDNLWICIEYQCEYNEETELYERSGVIYNIKLTSEELYFEVNNNGRVSKYFYSITDGLKFKAYLYNENDRFDEDRIYYASFDNGVFYSYTYLYAYNELPGLLKSEESQLYYFVDLNKEFSFYYSYDFRDGTFGMDTSYQNRSIIEFRLYDNETNQYIKLYSFDQPEKIDDENQIDSSYIPRDVEKFELVQYNDDRFEYKFKYQDHRSIWSKTIVNPYYIDGWDYYNNEEKAFYNGEDLAEIGVVSYINGTEVCIAPSFNVEKDIYDNSEFKFASDSDIENEYLKFMRFIKNPNLVFKAYGINVNEGLRDDFIRKINDFK